LRRPCSTPTEERKAVRAALDGNGCAALGASTSGQAPILNLCRRLVALGYDPAIPLEVFRDETLALRVRSIGEAARLELNGDGTGFRRRREPDASPPVRSRAPGGSGAPDDESEAYGRASDSAEAAA
jgi:hypothetical protein